MIRNIYLAGGMSGMSEEDSCAWRSRFSKALRAHGFVIYDPTLFQFYDRNDGDKDSLEKVAMNWDIQHIKDSDLVIMNFNNPFSIGTAIELGIIRENDIPVFGLNEFNNKLHPWQELMCNHIFSNEDDLISFIIKNFNIDRR